MTASPYEGRIRAVEIAQASQTSDLRSIQTGINEIKDQMRRLTLQPRSGVRNGDDGQGNLSGTAMPINDDTKPAIKSRQ